MASTAAGTLPIQSPDANTTTGDPVSGKRLFTKSCASCHFIPDPQIKRDRLWIEMLATTA